MAEVRLQHGDHGEWVEYLQKVFENKGISPGKTDGVFGDVLNGVVRTYQESNGLTVDGVVDTKTWASLKGESSSGGSTTVIDWAQLPFLSELAQYEATEAGMRQFLIDRGVDVDLLTGGPA
jgi:murein L,D-transpeptidase YcbB/YkuD